jgi:hypothetical protein
MEMNRIIILLVGLTIFSCNQSRTSRENIVIQDTVTQNKSTEVVIIDTLAGLFNNALTADTVEFLNGFIDPHKSFLFFKSGYIINRKEKNALVVVCPTDTTYTVKLYSIQNDKWSLTDSISNLDAFPVQFDVIFDDYNFDEQVDLYIQVTVSNGWPLSRGHLIIIDPKTKKLELHKEAREFANMTPDKKSKTVKSELWNGYDVMDRAQLTIFTHKWVNGKLKTASKKNITIKTN